MVNGWPQLCEAQREPNFARLRRAIGIEEKRVFFQEDTRRFMGAERGAGAGQFAPGAGNVLPGEAP